MGWEEKHHAATARRRTRRLDGTPVPVDEYDPWDFHARKVRMIRKVLRAALPEIDQVPVHHLDTLVFRLNLIYMEEERDGR